MINGGGSSSSCGKSCADGTAAGIGGSGCAGSSSSVCASVSSSVLAVPPLRSFRAGAVDSGASGGRAAGASSSSSVDAVSMPSSAIETTALTQRRRSRACRRARYSPQRQKMERSVNDPPWSTGLFCMRKLRFPLPRPSVRYIGVGLGTWARAWGIADIAMLLECKRR